MKKTAGVFSVALMLFVLLPGSSEAQVRFGFKGYGGLNKAAAGFSEYSDYVLGSYAHSGEIAPLRLGKDFGGEFALQFSKSMGIGLGVGAISAANESEIELTPAIPSVDFLWKPKVSAVPITATFTYYLPSGGKMNFFFNLHAPVRTHRGAQGPLCGMAQLRRLRGVDISSRRRVRKI